MSEYVRITDPQRIRALAHPLRLELMDVLADGGALTATECAAVTGESVASCSFHLRTLAKYGYIEPAPRRGREKPWQVIEVSTDMRPEEGNPEGVQALGAMAGVWLDRNVGRVRAYVDSISREPIEWLQASTLFGSSTWATPEELAELSETIQALTDRFVGRRADPSLRPPGARPIHVFAAAHVDIAKERRS